MRVLTAVRGQGLGSGLVWSCSVYSVAGGRSFLNCQLGERNKGMRMRVPVRYGSSETEFELFICLYNYGGSCFYRVLACSLVTLAVRRYGAE